MAGKRKADKNVDGWVDSVIVCYCLSALGHIGVVLAIIGYYIGFMPGEIALMIFFPALSMAGVFCMISVGMLLFSRKVRRKVQEGLHDPVAER